MTLFLVLVAAFVAWWMLRARGLPVDRALGPAFTLGALGFTLGFVGPMVFRPEANQGPLLGLLVTGPLGFVVGLVYGVIREMARGRK